MKASGKTLQVRWYSTAIVSKHQDGFIGTNNIRTKRPKGFWSDTSNHRRLFEEIGQHFHITHLDDWYNIRSKDVNDFVGKTFLNNFYRGSLYQALCSVYNEHDWKPWRFEHTRWLSLEKQQKDFFDWASKELNIHNLDDWYKVTTHQLRSVGGAGLLIHKYNGSLYDALKTIYPQHNWIPWRFKSVPKGFWTNLQNQVNFVNSISADLGITQLDDWYSKSNQQLIQKGMGSLLQHYNNSLYNLLKSIYPQHSWKAWRFSHVPKNYWGSMDNVIKFVVDANEQLSIVNLEDWYRISVEDINRLGGRSLLPRFDGFYGLLSNVYPHFKWNPVMFWTPRKRTTQRLLKMALKELFFGEEVIEDFSLGKIQLDLFIPAHKLAIEYQGKHHYQTIPYFGPHDRYTQHDFVKQHLCEKSGITLIEVPYWWDKKKASVAATIFHVRKDLKHLEAFTEGAVPLQTQPKQ